MLSSAYSQRKVLTPFTGWLSPATIVLWKCLFLFIAYSKHWRWAFIPCVSRALLITGWNSVCELRSRLYRKIRNTPEASRTKSIYTSRDQAQYVWHGLVNTADERGSCSRDFRRVALGFPTKRFFIRKLPFDHNQVFSQELVHPGENLS